MFTNLLAATSSTIGPDVQTVKELTEVSNTYGFMTVFSVIILILIVIFFIAYQKTSNKRQSTELEILKKERENSLEQHNKMYDMVVGVQTEQVIQLQAMTDTLRNLNNRSVENRDKISDIGMTVHKMDDSIKSVVENDNTIRLTLSEVLSYVKNNDSTNKEILDKVNQLTDFFRQNQNRENI